MNGPQPLPHGFAVDPARHADDGGMGLRPDAPDVKVDKACVARPLDARAHFLDQMVVGDTFTWTDDTGTAAFEVVSINTCPAASGCPGVAGALVLSTTDEPFTDRAALHVYARRTA